MQVSAQTRESPTATPTPTTNTGGSGNPNAGSAGNNIYDEGSLEDVSISTNLI